jgi:hypothetical protein
MVLAGCESDEEVAADMERSLREANVALVGALLSAEMMGHVYDEPDRQLRHGYEICGCPCTQRIGTEAPFVMTLDFDPNGCVPESGLVSTALAGHATLDFDGTQVSLSSWDNLMFALEHEVGGDLKGSVTTDEVTAIEVHGPLDIGPESITLELQMVVDEVGITIDGTATVASDDPRPVTFDEVALTYEEISPPCPAPSTGSATLVNSEKDDKNVVIAFSEPGEGFVKVARDDRVSEAADWCAYASELW